MSGAHHNRIIYLWNRIHTPGIRNDVTPEFERKFQMLHCLGYMQTWKTYRPVFFKVLFIYLSVCTVCCYDDQIIKITLKNKDTNILSSHL